MLNHPVAETFISTKLMCILVVLPLFMPNMRRFSFTPLPGVNLLNIFFVVALVLFFSARGQFRDPPRAAPLRPYLFFFWFVSLMAMINAWIQGDKPASIDDIIFYKNHVFYMGLYFLYFHAVRDRKTLEWVWWALVVVTAVAGLQAVRQYMSLGASAYSTGARVSGPFGEGWEQSNTAGVFYAQYAPIVLAELIYQKRKLLKLGLLGAFIITVMGLFYTYSRKSYYALAAGAVLMGASASKLLMICITAVILSFPVWAPDSAVQRLLGTQEEKETGAKDESTESRYILWEGAMNMWQEHPLGVGLERFKHHIGSYSTISNLDAHNYYVLVWAEMGPLGEVAYLLMVFMMWREGAKLAKVARTPREKAVASAYRGGMLAFIIANTFGSAFNFGDMMGNLWVLTGLVSRLRFMIEDELAGEKKPATKPRMMA